MAKAIIAGEKMEKERDTYYQVLFLAVIVYVSLIAAKIFGYYQMISWLWLLLPLWFPLLFIVVLLLISLPIGIAKVVETKANEEEKEE